jgi:hypothetical protein
MNKIKVLFIGGLNSSGNKGKYLYKELENKGFDVTVDIITPNYILDDSKFVLSELEKQLTNNYDCIVASSTGGLFLITSIINNHLVNKPKVILINPLLSLSRTLLKNKEPEFLENVLPLMNSLENKSFANSDINYSFLMSINDEVIGSQDRIISALKFLNKKMIKVDDTHRMGKSMDVIVNDIIKYWEVAK